MFNRRAILVPLILIVALVGFTTAATKPLYEINIPRSDTFPADHYEKAVLESADDGHESLSVTGYYSIDFPVRSDGKRYQARTDYVADKDGYRAKFRMMLIPSENVIEPRLGILSLKTAAG